jgi:sensor histidine kinase YesM
MLTIQFENKENYLLTTIEDNGIGRQKAKELTSKSATKHKSFGLQITAERFELIKKNLLQNISFEIIDLKDDRQNAAGTRVEIKFFNAKI